MKGNTFFSILTCDAIALLYLMFLPALALLLDLLLFLQFLCDAGLSQRLPLAPFVGLGIKCGL